MILILTVLPVETDPLSLESFFQCDLISSSPRLIRPDLTLANKQAIYKCPEAEALFLDNAALFWPYEQDDHQPQ